VIIGDIALGVGLAGVAGGLIWQMVLNKPRLLKPRAPHASPAPKTRVAPALAPGFGGLSVAGAF
jgi:hypothetical protein